MRSTIGQVDLGSEHLRFLGDTRFHVYALWRIISLRKYAARVSYIEACDLPHGQQLLESLPDESSPLWQYAEEGEFAGVTLSNLSHMGPGMMIAPGRKLGDGSWTMCWLPYKSSSFGTLVKGLTKMEMGTHVSIIVAVVGDRTCAGFACEGSCT